MRFVAVPARVSGVVTVVGLRLAEQPLRGESAEGRSSH